MSQYMSFNWIIQTISIHNYFLILQYLVLYQSPIHFWFCIVYFFPVTSQMCLFIYPSFQYVKTTLSSLMQNLVVMHSFSCVYYGNVFLKVFVLLLHAGACRSQRGCWVLCGLVTHNHEPLCGCQGQNKLSQCSQTLSTEH